MTATVAAGPAFSPDLRLGGRFAGTGELLRLALRRDRVVLPLWMLLLSVPYLLGSRDIALPADHPLWTIPGVTISPHIGGASSVFHRRADRVIKSQLHRWAAGEPLANVVKQPTAG